MTSALEDVEAHWHIRLIHNQRNSQSHSKECGRNAEGMRKECGSLQGMQFTLTARHEIHNLTARMRFTTEKSPGARTAGNGTDDRESLVPSIEFVSEKDAQCAREVVHRCQRVRVADAKNLPPQFQNIEVP
jgi:hypothetical protein